MELTKNDAHICRILFDQSTHDMAIAMYGDRAKKIWGYFRSWLKVLFMPYYYRMKELIINQIF